MSQNLILPLDDLKFDNAMQKAKIGLISLALLQTKGNRCHAARVLGVHRNTLSRQLVALGLNHWPRELKKQRSFAGKFLRGRVS